MTARDDVLALALKHDWTRSRPAWSSTDAVVYLPRDRLRITVAFSATGAIRSATALERIDTSDPRAATARERLRNNIQRGDDGVLRVHAWGISPRTTRKRETLLEHLRRGM